VDDDPAFREGLGALLAAEGFRVRTAGDGLQALKHIIETRFDAAIVDLALPAVLGVPLSGWEVARMARAWDPAVALVIISADVDATVRRRARELDAEACLEKPVHWPELRALIAGLRGQRRERAAGPGGAPGPAPR
jgi:CheY-like chemotaxis protein